MKATFVGLIVSAGFGISVGAATVTVNWSTARALTEAGGVPPLSSGGASSGDGTLVQLGYFSEGSASSPFSGNWVVLSTAGMGDDGVEQPGFFSITTVFESGSFVEPAVGTPLGIRFFDGTSLATSAFYNTAVNADGSGDWAGPSDQGSMIVLQLAKGTSAFESGVIGAFETWIPIPEPSLSILVLLGFGHCLLRRNPSSSF